MTGWRPNGDQIRAGALAGADLSRFDLQGFHFRQADLRGASFAGSILREVDLWSADLTGADLTGANLRLATFKGANLQGARLAGADLWSADLKVADLGGAILSECNLAQAELAGAKCRGADFSGAELYCADLRLADLEDANLGRADGRLAKLEEAVLIGANLRDANFSGASFKRARLATADLGGANLREANFREADLIRVDFRGAEVADAFFGQANLDGTVMPDGTIEIGEPPSLDPARGRRVDVFARPRSSRPEVDRSPARFQRRQNNRQRQSGEIQGGGASTGSCCSQARTLKSAHLISCLPRRALPGSWCGAPGEVPAPRLRHATREQSGRGRRSVRAHASQTCARKTLCDAGVRPKFRARDPAGVRDSGASDSVPRNPTYPT